jgi:hypothetical protein
VPEPCEALRDRRAHPARSGYADLHDTLSPCPIFLLLR